jgi:DNA invertase Pin-like site-specific DNA recombinase
MTKITPEHLARSAVVYIRQSTPQQVTHNLESQRRQYALVERGRQLGWGEVQVIDDDLGRSGDGGAARPGFDKLLAAICEGRIGAVFSIEASRLARNGRDWHTLLEFCGVVDTLIVDEDGIYDPRLPNDRLLLGMKGTMSEMELSILRQRAGEAQEAEGSSRRALRKRRCRLFEDRRRQDRKRARSPGAGGNCTCLPEVHGAAERTASVSLDDAAADSAASCHLHRRQSVD